MNKLYRLLSRIFDDDVTVEKPEMTTEDIRRKIEKRREEDAEHATQFANLQAEIKEKLKTFPIDLPASATEIASMYDIYTFTMQVALDKMVNEESPSWKYVNIDCCTLYQRTK